jgi:hypothetical protein
MYYVYCSKIYEKKKVNKELLKRSISDFMLNLKDIIPVYRYLVRTEDKSLKFLFKLMGYQLFYQQIDNDDLYDIHIYNGRNRVSDLETTVSEYLYVEDILLSDDIVFKDKILKGVLVKNFGNIVEIQDNFKNCQFEYFYLENK